MHSGTLMLCPPENVGTGTEWNLQIPSPAWIARAGIAFQPQALTIWKNKYKNIDKAYRLCIFRCIIRLPYEVTHFRVYCQQTYYTPKCFIRHFLLKTCKVVLNKDSAYWNTLADLFNTYCDELGLNYVNYFYHEKLVKEKLNNQQINCEKANTSIE